MIIFKTRLFQSTYILFIQLAVIGLLLFSSCGGENSTGNKSEEIVDIEISPDDATLEAGEELEFSAFVVTESGKRINTEDIDFDWDGEWWSTDTDVFTVENNGLATGQNSGEAYCVVEVNLDETRIYTMKKNESIDVAGFFPTGMSLKPAIKTYTFKKRKRFVGRDSVAVMVF